MKKGIKFLFGAMALSSVFLFASCDNKPQNEDSSKVDDQSIDQEVDNRRQIYLLAKESGYTGTYEEWLESIRGAQIELVTLNNVLMWKYSNESNSEYRVLFDFSKFIVNDDSNPNNSNPNVFEDCSYEYNGNQIGKVYLKVDTENHIILERRLHFDGVKWVPYYGVSLTVITYKNTIDEVLKREVTVWDYEKEKEVGTYTSYKSTYDDNDILVEEVWQIWDHNENKAYLSSRKEYTFDNDGKQTTIESNWSKETEEWVLSKKTVKKETSNYYLNEEYNWSIEDNKWIGERKTIIDNGQSYYYHWNFELDDWELETY